MKQMSGVYPQFAHERDEGHTQKLCPVPSLTLKLLLMPPAADEPWRISWEPRWTWRLQVAEATPQMWELEPCVMSRRALLPVPRLATRTASLFSSGRPNGA